MRRKGKWKKVKICYELVKIMLYVERNFAMSTNIEEPKAQPTENTCLVVRPKH